MPNWCSNYVKVEGKVSDIVKCISGMKGKRPCYACQIDKISKETKDEIFYTFNATVPVPDEIQAQTYNDAGYDWQISSWGTKWDTLYESASTFDSILKELSELDQDEITSTCFDFSTAWAPPENWLLELARLNPGIDFSMCYEEGGCCLYGTIDVKDDSYSRTAYGTEAEYIYYADCDCDINDTFDITSERNECYTVKSEFIEILTEEFNFYEDQEYIIKKINDYANSITDWEEEIEEKELEEVLK